MGTIVKSYVNNVRFGPWRWSNICLRSCVCLILRVGFHLSELHTIPERERCTGWVALRHLWYNIIGWTVGYRIGYRPFYLRLYFFAGRGVADALVTYLLGGRFYSWIGVQVEAVFRMFRRRFGTLLLCQPIAVRIRGLLWRAFRNIREVGFTRNDEHCARLTRNCLSLRRWMLYAKQNGQNGALSIDVTNDDCENDRRVFLGCWCHIVIFVGVNQDREDDTFLRHDLVNEDEFELILLALPPRLPAFLRRLFIFSLWRGALVLR